MSIPWKHLILIGVLGIVAGALAIVIGFLLFRSPEISQKPESHRMTPVSVLEAPGPAATRQLTVSGILDAEEGVPLISRSGGTVVDVYVQAGDTLKKGQPVLRFDRTALRREYQILQVELARSQAALQMELTGKASVVNRAGLDGTLMRLHETQQLVERTQTQELDAPYQHALKQTTASLNQLESMIETQLEKQESTPLPATSPAASAIQQHLNQVLERLSVVQGALAEDTLVSPEAGRVVSMEVEPETVLQPNTPVGRITVASKPVIKAALPKDALLALKKGDSVLIVIKRSPAIRLQGRILSLQSADETSEEVGRVNVMVLQGFPGKLTAEDAIELTFQLAQEGGVWIPEAAVCKHKGQPVVFIAEKTERGWTALAKSVQIGERSTGNVEILEGLSPGEKMIVEGACLLDDRQRISILGLDDHELDTRF